MSIRLLDTNIISYVVKRHSLALRYQSHLAGHLLGICFQTIAEIEENFASGHWGAVRRTRLDHLLGRAVIYQSTPRIVQRYVEIRIATRKQLMSVADTWIAATAIAYNLDLVTHNPADFANVPGLTVISEAP